MSTARDDTRDGTRAAVSGSPPIALTKADLAYQHLRREILEGALRPKMSLDQEALAARLGLSTTPVREALRRLESEGLVVGKAHRDTVVAELSLGLLEETYAVRVILDPLAVSMTAANASRDRLLAISRLARRPVSADASEELHQNRELHRAVYSACGNTVLVEILDLLWDRTDRYRFLTIEEHVHSPHGEHADIVDAVLARDGNRAAELMRGHVSSSLERIRNSPKISPESRSDPRPGQ